MNQDTSHISPRQLSDAELDQRLAASADLLDVARPHVEWLATAQGSVPHVASLVDSDGIVLHSTGSPDAIEAACTRAPVRAPSGEVIGAICVSTASTLSTTAEPGAAELRLAVAHAAFAIERELHHRDSQRTSATLTTESLLRESETRFRQLVEFSPVGVAVHTDLRFQYVNPAMAQLLGYDSPSELVGTPVLDIVHPELHAQARGRIAEVEAGARVPVREYRLVRRDGSLIHAETAGVSTTFEGRPAMQIVVRDVTERRRADDALRASEARFRSLSAASPVGVYMSDAQGAISYANPQVLQIFGMTEAEALGHGWLARLHPEDVDPVTTGWAAALREERSYEHEYRLYMPDGTIRWVHCRSAPLYDGEGTMIGNVGSIEDITVRKELEAQLRQVQKMDAVGQLAGGVAHDFNNLLTVIRMHVELALEELGTEHPLHADIHEVAKAAGRAAALTRQLLAFSRQQVLRPQALGLNAVIADLHKMLTRLIGEDIEFAVDLASDLDPVLADPGQLEQVLVNLAINARDAMPRGGRLTIVTRNVQLSALEAARHPGARPGSFVAVALRDTGTGMTPDVQARIFEPFFTTKQVGQGTGLGLATVYGIVAQSEGFLEVKSAPGRGSMFTVYLPSVPGAGATSSRNTAASAVRTGGTETILLVEDEDAVRAIARRVLAKHGYTVIEARNGGEALSLLVRSDQAIDMVLTDAVMPQMSGPELATAIASMRPELPVILMSGYTDVDLLRRGALDSGASILAKPFTVESLLRAVRLPLDRVVRPSDRLT